MSAFVQITTTTATRDDAERIASELIARRLAGCVQVSGPIRSIYRWQGAVETAEEWLCTIKTTEERMNAVLNCVKELHTYEVPEVIAIPIVGGNEAYLRWLAEQVAEGERS